MQTGGDGLLSSPRQYSIFRAFDISSANSSSCPQVFHREQDSPRREVTGIVQVRAHARMLRAPRTVSAWRSHDGVPKVRKSPHRHSFFKFLDLESPAGSRGQGFLPIRFAILARVLRRGFVTSSRSMRAISFAVTPGKSF